MIVRYVINTLTAGVDPGAYELAARVLLPGRQDPALNIVKSIVLLRLR
jgi:hypothetical protein